MLRGGSLGELSQAAFFLQFYFTFLEHEPVLLLRFFPLSIFHLHGVSYKPFKLINQGQQFTIVISAVSYLKT
jgi:hypothetical protein